MIALAALSARTLAEAACREGLAAQALDVFGDTDTQAAAARWWPVGEPGGLRIDAARLLPALAAIAHADAAIGWIAGSGFEGRTDLLEAGARRLPLIGSAPADLARLQTPRDFFAQLARDGLAHPPVAFEPPAAPAGWLHKSLASCGGALVRPARADDAVRPGVYWQREAAGTPWSATFVANGYDAVVLGFNRQLVQPASDRPFRFAGVVGPLPLAAPVAAAVGAALRALVRAYRVRGLGSLDVLLGGDDAVTLLELNARPPASVALYAHARPLRAHLRACGDGVLPTPAPPTVVQGLATVFAPQALALSAPAAAALAARPGTHDLPPAGSMFAAGDPVCSVSAQGPDGPTVMTILAQRGDAVRRLLEADR